MYEYSIPLENINPCIVVTDYRDRLHFNVFNSQASHIKALHNHIPVKA